MVPWEVETTLIAWSSRTEHGVVRTLAVYTVWTLQQQCGGDYENLPLSSIRVTSLYSTRSEELAAQRPQLSL